MDMDIEKIHNILIEADLPSSIDDLKNPTEDFVVNLMNKFLKRFQIDITVIDKPTIEQRDVMLYCEDCEILGLINLHVAMVQICDRIWCKGLCITDITNPGSKKVRKQAKFLANFILYANNKESDMEDKINEIQSKPKTLHRMLEKLNEVCEARNEKALHTSKQMSKKEKYVDEIQKLHVEIKNNNKKYLELMSIVSADEEKKDDASVIYGSYKSQALELTKTVAELQSEIVKNPEEYQRQLSELEQQQNAKTKERETMQESCHDKKHSIEQRNNILAFMQKRLDKLIRAREAHDKLKKVKAQEDGVKKQIDILKADIAKFERRLESQKDQTKDIEIDEIHVQCEERLNPLRNTLSQFLSNKKVKKSKLEEVQTQYNENCLKLKEMQNKVEKWEGEIITLLRNYQNLYNNEILTEKVLLETWANK